MRCLRDRFQENIHSVEKNLSTNVARHFNGDIAMRVQVIERIRAPKRGGDVFRTLGGVLGLPFTDSDTSRFKL